MENPDEITLMPSWETVADFFFFFFLSKLWGPTLHAPSKYEDLTLQLPRYATLLGTDYFFPEADEAYVIGKRGQYTPVGAYLAGNEIIKIAVEHGAQLVHPG